MSAPNPIDKVIETKFELTDGVYAFGEIPEKTDKVGLWLGADVMVEYTLEEAAALLKSNLEKSDINLKTYVNPKNQLLGGRYFFPEGADYNHATIIKVL